MNLHAFELENFKCYGRRQVVEIGLVTLVLGANSSGKSTLLQSVLALQGSGS